MGGRLTDTLSKKISKYESAVYFGLLLFRSVRISLFGSVSVVGLGTQQSLRSPNEPPYVAYVFRICRQITVANVAGLACWWRVLNELYSI